MLHLFRSIGFLAFQFDGDFFEILYGGLQIFHNILRKDIGIGEIIQVCQRFIFDPENIQTGFVPSGDFFVSVFAPTAIRIAFTPGLQTVKAVCRIIAGDRINL